jgi:hypothetical protein
VNISSNPSRADLIKDAMTRSMLFVAGEGDAATKTPRRLDKEHAHEAKAVPSVSADAP